jgi:hypothetical protein
MLAGGAKHWPLSLNLGLHVSSTPWRTTAPRIARSTGAWLSAANELNCTGFSPCAAEGCQRVAVRAILAESSPYQALISHHFVHGEVNN